MPTRYSPDYKSLVTRLLFMYGGNVSLVSHLTGIPQRTLRDWRWEGIPSAMFTAAIRREDDPQRREQTSQPPQNDSSTAAVDDFDILRERLMQQALSLVNSLSEEVEDAPLHQRSLALARLIDRIMKLKSHASSYEVEHVRIAFDRPSYEQDDDEWNDDEDGSYPSQDDPQPDATSASADDST